MPFSSAMRDSMARQMAQACVLAGDALLAVSREALLRDTKADGSPVSAADYAAERVLQAQLRAHFPQFRVVSEEDAASHAALPGQGASEPFFLIDPLDGTRGFLRGRPDFCVLVALIANGVPVAGALHAPATGESWWAGAQAFKATDRDFASSTPLVPRPLAQPGKLAGIISTSHGEAFERAIQHKFGFETLSTLNSALKFAVLAEGRADLYPRKGRTMAWDIAAGDAVLRALGGGVFTLDGAPFTYPAGQTGWENPSFIAARHTDLLPIFADGLALALR